MTQETRETTNAIIEDDNKVIQKIIEANALVKEKYWIVLFAKPSKHSVDGKLALVKHIKPYLTKPSSQVGMIIGEVDNSKGTVTWEVNMPQRPLDYDGLIALGAERCDEEVVETSSIPQAYITQ